MKYACIADLDSEPHNVVLEYVQAGRQPSEMCEAHATSEKGLAENACATAGQRYAGCRREILESIDSLGTASSTASVTQHGPLRVSEEKAAAYTGELDECRLLGGVGSIGN